MACTSSLSEELVPERAALRLRLDAPAGAEVVVFVGAPWDGADPLVSHVPGVPPLRLVEPQVLFRGDAAQAADGVLLKRVNLAGLPDPCVVQAVVRAGDDVRVGRAFVVDHGDGPLTSETYAGHVLGRDVLTVAVVLVVALVGLGLGVVRWPRGGAARLGRGVLVGLLVATLAGRFLQGAERLPVERGLAEPPLVWPPSWSVDDDVLDRTAGPGFRQLVEATRNAAGDPLRIWSGPTGKDISRALLLGHALDAPVAFFHDEAPRGGRALYVGAAPRGEVLYRAECGVLCRDGDEP